MKHYLAFLRGMNLGNRRIKNPELVVHFERMGLEEVAAIAAREPFDAKAIAKSKGKPQVQMLAEKPSAAAKKKAPALAGPDDEMVFEGRELHWLSSTGLSETEVDLKAIDEVLGKGTMRTMGTIEQIAAKYCG